MRTVICPRVSLSSIKAKTSNQKICPQIPSSKLSTVAWNNPRSSIHKCSFNSSSSSSKSKEREVFPQIFSKKHRHLLPAFNNSRCSKILQRRESLPQLGLLLSIRALICINNSSINTEEFLLVLLIYLREGCRCQVRQIKLWNLSQEPRYKIKLKTIRDHLAQDQPLKDHRPQIRESERMVSHQVQALAWQLTTQSRALQALFYEAMRHLTQGQ